MAPSAEIDKTTKECTKTQKVINISTIISPLEPSAPQETFLVSKIPTGVSILSGIGASVTPEKRIPRKKNEVEITSNVTSKKGPNPKSI